MIFYTKQMQAWLGGYEATAWRQIEAEQKKHGKKSANGSKGAARSNPRRQHHRGGWGEGTVLMPGTPVNDAPGWMGEE